MRKAWIIRNTPSQSSMSPWDPKMGADATACPSLDMLHPHQFQ